MVQHARVGASPCPGLSDEASLAEQSPHTILATLYKLMPHGGTPRVSFPSFFFKSACNVRIWAAGDFCRASAAPDLESPVML